MTPQQLKQEIEVMLKSKPSCYRKGQAVFNYIDFEYGVARDVQLKDGVDCFHNDENIDKFIECAAKRIKTKKD